MDKTVLPDDRVTAGAVAFSTPGCSPLVANKDSVACGVYPSLHDLGKSEHATSRHLTKHRLPETKSVIPDSSRFADTASSNSKVSSPVLRSRSLQDGGSRTRSGTVSTMSLTCQAGLTIVEAAEASRQRDTRPPVVTANMHTR